MINKKLLSFDRAALRYVGANVAFQWLGLGCNIIFVRAVARLVGAAFAGSLTAAALRQNILLCLGTVPLRFAFTMLASGMSDQASRDVKRTLRSKIYEKLTRLGPGYTETVATSEVVMLASEGVEQIDTYFAKYLPQLFYSLLAPVTLFALLVGVHARSAVILLCCVPLIPMSIVAVQKFAKKLLASYWSEYTTLGDSFLENIQGLTTLKIYQADGWKHEQMNAEAERFRKITMRVLTMQLNSVTLMDLMAYGGAGLGIISAVAAFAAGKLELTATLTILLLAADFFLPLRLLGSYFHIAMNGAASAEKIFRLLAAEEPQDGAQNAPADTTLALEDVTFGYEADRTVLKDVSFTVPQGSFVSLVGASGSGKSTIAALLAGRRTGYTGRVTMGGVPVQQLQRAARQRALTVVPHDSTIFKGTVESNLRMAKPQATESELWAALEEVNLADFCRSQNGLQTAVHEGGSNLSGGQRQRLAMARALLHDTPIYLFDEATSNVDAESENDIMAAIRRLAGKKTVILISHRLANVVDSDCIYVLENGSIPSRAPTRSCWRSRALTDACTPPRSSWKPLQRRMPDERHNHPPHPRRHCGAADRAGKTHAAHHAGSHRYGRGGAFLRHLHHHFRRLCHPDRGRAAKPAAHRGHGLRVHSGVCFAARRAALCGAGVQPLYRLPAAGAHPG